MWTELLSAAAANGIWAVLFVSMLIYCLQDGRKREARYQDVIQTLTDRLEVVEEIRDDIVKLRQSLVRRRAVVADKKGEEVA